MEIYPSFKDFFTLAKKNNIVVLSYKFYSDWFTPVSIYYNLRKIFKGESFLLESVEGEEKLSRFSFLGFLPFCVFKSLGKTIYFRQKFLNIFTTERNPLFELKKIMRSFKVAPKENLRLFGGFVGYLGYDIVRFYEPIGKDLVDPLNQFDSYFILPKILVIFDHLKREIEFLSFVKVEPKMDFKTIYFKEVKKIKSILKKINQSVKLSPLNFSSLENKKIKFKSNFKKSEFINIVKKAKQYIKEGEIIQVVLSQRFSLEFKKDPFEVYRYLRILNPSPYMFYLDFKDIKLAGSSPEMLLRCERRNLVTRPIAGTRKRGRDENEDNELENSLLNDPKEKAEHIMLVDLARNDLGKVALKGSVKVPIFMSIEKFSHVMHIVSEVRANLDKRKDIFSALESCFPAGTVSGAPKVRAMQIINELEKEKRGIYAGCVGYFSFTNNLDTGIIIRTIVFKNNRAYIQAGAGIVNDSKPKKEFKETLNKAKAQILAVELAKQKEEVLC